MFKPYMLCDSVQQEVKELRRTIKALEAELSGPPFTARGAALLRASLSDVRARLSVLIVNG